MGAPRHDGIRERMTCGYCLAKKDREVSELNALRRVAEAARKHYGADVDLDAALDALDEATK